MAAGILSLNAFHPAMCFKEGYVKREKVKGEKKSRFGKKNKSGGVDVASESSSAVVKEEHKNAESGHA